MKPDRQSPAYESDCGRAALYRGDCLEVLSTLPENHFDAIVTDPPYELGFMGKKWDGTGVSFDPETWRAVKRVAKPGAHLLAMGGTRTFHRLACAIEDAGWEIRDCVMWVYGMGFPKSHDVSKAIDKAAGAEREVLRRSLNDRNANSAIHFNRKGNGYITAPATEAARKWSGYGTALKPAWEPIIVARKPLDGTVAGNCFKWGCCGLNIDGSRVGAGGPSPSVKRRKGKPLPEPSGVWPTWHDRTKWGEYRPSEELGRWPANLIHDGSADVTRLFPSSSSSFMKPPQKSDDWIFKWRGTGRQGHDDAGSNARFFYCAKASQKERAYGMPDGKKTLHPTVKPLALARYLIRLVSPPGGARVLDPFVGSGTFGIAAMEEGAKSFTGIDLDPDDAISRVGFAASQSHKQAEAKGAS